VVRTSNTLIDQQQTTTITPLDPIAGPKAAQQDRGDISDFDLSSPWGGKQIGDAAGVAPQGYLHT
jgi:hypothetical protein